MVALMAEHWGKKLAVELADNWVELMVVSQVACSDLLKVGQLVFLTVEMKGEKTAEMKDEKRVDLKD
jgi:hypothetical protein